jgi:hypothetical protein
VVVVGFCYLPTADSPANIITGKPVAVIYPPIRDLVLQNARCHHNRLSQHPVLSDNRTEVLLTFGKFNVLVVGRIVRLKYPGVVIRALGWLHRALSSLQGNAVETVDTTGGAVETKLSVGDWATGSQLEGLLQVADEWRPSEESGKTNKICQHDMLGGQSLTCSPC